MARKQSVSGSNEGRHRERRTAKSHDAVSHALARCQAELSRHFTRDIDRKAACDTVAVFVASARVEQTPPERVIAMLKKMLVRMPEVIAMPQEDRDVLMRQLVETAIEEYFRDGTR